MSDATDTTASMTPQQKAELILAFLTLAANILPRLYEPIAALVKKEHPELFPAPPDAPTAEELSKADAAAVASKFGEGA